MTPFNYVDVCSSWHVPEEVPADALYAFVVGDYCESAPVVRIGDCWRGPIPHFAHFLVEDLSSFSVPAKPVAMSVIIGAKRMDELQENLAAAEFVLSADEMNQLDEVSAIPEEYLNWVVSFASQNRLEVAHVLKALARQRVLVDWIPVVRQRRIASYGLVCACLRDRSGDGHCKSDEIIWKSPAGQ
jgi:hypothetical protein